jgi:hypothetical protein
VISVSLDGCSKSEPSGTSGHLYSSDPIQIDANKRQNMSGNGNSGDGKIPNFSRGNKGVSIVNISKNYSSDSETEQKVGISLGGSKSAKLLAKELKNLTK